MTRSLDPPTEWNEAGTVQGFPAWWFPHQDKYPEKKIRVSCDRCNRVVWPEQPRFRIQDGQGKPRPGSKQSAKKQHSYLCVSCAWDHYSQRQPDHPYRSPITYDPMDQGNLFP
jgi:hypothetical protein